MKEYLNMSKLETLFEKENNQFKKFEESKREHNTWKKEQEEITKKLDASFKSGFDYAKRLYEPLEEYKIPPLTFFKKYNNSGFD